MNNWRGLGSQAVALILFCAVFMLGIVYFMFGVRLQIQDDKFMQNAIKTTATIESKEENYNTYSTYKYQVSYDTSKVKYSFFLEDKGKRQVGDKLTVFYNEKYPNKVKIEGERNPIASCYFSSIIYILVAIWGISFILINIHETKIQEQES